MMVCWMTIVCVVLSVGVVVVYICGSTIRVRAIGKLFVVV